MKTQAWGIMGHLKWDYYVVDTVHMRHFVLVACVGISIQIGWPLLMMLNNEALLIIFIPVKDKIRDLTSKTGERKQIWD